MSEGVENTRPGGTARFWAKRWHSIVDALVESGIAEIDRGQYEKIKQQMVREGWSPSQAATIAFNLGREARLRHASACEVNPW